MNNPKVSICIPAYKQPELLKKALDSVAIQSYTDYEVIITDDSPDDTVEEVAKEYKSKVKNLTYVKNKERKGSPENWNESISLAKGDYIKILHHDDWFAKDDSLERFVRLLDENPNAVFAWGGTIDMDQNDEVVKFVKTKPRAAAALKADPKFLFLGNIIGAPSATIYRKNDLKFDINLKWLVDTEFYMQILMNNNNFAFTTDPLICVLAESEERVTAECINDKDIQIFEHSYVYRKIDGKVNHSRYKYLWSLFQQFNVQNLSELYSMGMQDPIPEDIVNIVRFQKFSRFGMHITYFIRKALTPEIWIGFIARSLAYLVSMF